MIPTEQKSISIEEKSILNALIYYDVFDHPLSFEELSKSGIMHKVHSANEFRASLEKLRSEGLIGEKNQYYFLGEKEWTVDSRLSEQKRVKHFMMMARISSRIISTFPFVRAVLISGALSKERVEKKGDIDFFIITEPGRLWLSRTLLVLFKKIFLLNSFKYFCLNYFIDTRSFDVPNKSLYTATDIVTLLPVYNMSLYSDFLAVNDWAYEYYPNYPQRKAPFSVHPYSKSLKKFFEFLFNNRIGDVLDNFLMKKTLHYRKKKFDQLPETRFNKAFITKKNVSTHHPNDFQDIIMEKYFRNQQAFEERFSLSLRFDVETIRG